MGNSMVLCFHGFNMVLITEQMGLLCRTSNRTHASQFISCHHWHSYRGILLHCLSKCSLHSHDKHHQHLQAYWIMSHFLQLLKLNQNKKISSLLSYIIQSLSQFLNSFDPCCNMPGFLMFCGEIFLLLERQAHLLSSDSCGWSEYRERAWPWWPRNQSGDLCCHSYNYMDTLSPDN